MTVPNSPEFRAVVVYESMFGNTQAVAAAIALGIDPGGSVPVIPVAFATPDVVADADLLVVGGPTHAHGMSRPSTRRAAGDMGGPSGRQLTLDAARQGPGAREWLASLAPGDCLAAAFDTRVRAPAALTGRASRRIAQQLRRRGHQLADAPKSFFVTKDNTLLPGEEERARQWGALLAGRLAARPDHHESEV
jgi:hypothetical protein